MFIISMKSEAANSQAGEIIQLAEFPWRFLSSNIYNFVYYRHLILNARVITFVTITQLGFMLLLLLLLLLIKNCFFPSMNIYYEKTVEVNKELKLNHPE